MVKYLWIALLATTFASAKQQTPNYKDNFYQAVNQKWIDTHPIPDDKQDVSSFTAIDELLNKRFSQMLNGMTKQKRLSKNEKILLDFYLSYKDTKARNAKGITPIKKELKAIDAIKSTKDLAHMLPHMPKFSLLASSATPFVFAVNTDEKNSSLTIVGGGQGGLTLEKKYYESNSSDAVKKRKNYLKYTTELLHLAQISDPEKAAKSNMRVETALAKASWTLAKISDVKNTTNPMDFARLEKMMSHLDMPYFFKIRGYPTDRKINIDEPSYFREVNRLATALPLEDWKNYLRVRLLLQSVDYLSEDFVNAKQAYLQSEGLSKKLEPLDIRAIHMTNYNLAYLFGRVYVEHFFNKKSKAEVEKILQTIIDQYRKTIKKTDRFDAATKKAALKKIEHMQFKVAYPDVWRDYGDLSLDPADLIGNLRKIDGLNKAWDSADLKRGTVNKELWEMAPQFVNAYYDPSKNRFNLLAAILNPPFYDTNASTVAKYAGIGFVIGHEIGHAFDSRGSNYDEYGNLKGWWSKKDLEKFAILKKALIDEADAYEVLPGLYNNGIVEIGEIMADLSGAEIALSAYLKTVEGDASVKKEATRAFFIHLAKVWRKNIREGVLRQQNDSNPHPADEYRINGTVRNMDAFYKAFDVKKGDKMYLTPEKRVKIW